ncbi:hypothetical protein KSP39_PZI023618 [Platanthera zijinensis]|uniref:Uncharacterized protein n=1 Tax=Platanthera zijinensis TaxID=2320716 RepID=A0AAP0FU04_9ASPA
MQGKVCLHFTHVLGPCPGASLRGDALCTRLPFFLPKALFVSFFLSVTSKFLIHSIHKHTSKYPPLLQLHAPLIIPPLQFQSLLKNHASVGPSKSELFSFYKAFGTLSQMAMNTKQRRPLHIPWRKTNSNKIQKIRREMQGPCFPFNKDSTKHFFSKNHGCHNC